MILTKLHLENFKKYTTYEIEFGEGLIGIIGKNGSGKSTIFEAILFALYGEFKERGVKELVRNANATTKDIVVVELSFEFDSDEYRVVREFRGKAMSANAKLYKNEELTTSGAREVTNAIVALTKMSKDAFMHTLFASQKELTSLSTLKNEDRKKMIRRLLGLEKIDFIEKELVEKSRELKRTISAFDEVLLGEEELTAKKTQLVEIKTLQESLAKELNTKELEFQETKVVEEKLKKELDLFVKTKESKQKAQSEIELLKSRLSSEQEREKKLQNELQELAQKAEELQKLSSVKEEYTKLQEALKMQESAKESHLKKEGLEKEQDELREQYKKAQKDSESLEKECGVYESLLKSQELQNKKLLTLKERQTQTQKKERELNARLSAERRVISDTNEKIQKIQNLGASSACPTCTRPLLEEYDNVLGILYSTIEELQKGKIAQFSTELEQLSYELQTIQTQRTKEESELQT
ncbi:MAG: SMC family ATPase, partial [Campylobacterota bacterium]|nr:SMC family ATPase [Campylobacterota bacterium]